MTSKDSTYSEVKAVFSNHHQQRYLNSLFPNSSSLLSTLSTHQTKQGRNVASRTADTLGPPLGIPELNMVITNCELLKVSQAPLINGLIELYQTTVFKILKKERKKKGRTTWFIYSTKQ